MTIKGLATIQWIRQMIPNVKYVFKTDDDVIMNIPGWIKEVQELEKTKCHMCMACFFHQNALVKRSGKWAITEKEYHDKHYPTYCAGPGYLLTSDTMDVIRKNSLQIPLFRMEDVYLLTGILVQNSGVKFRKFNQSSYWLYKNVNKKPLTSSTDFLLIMADVFSFSKWEEFWQDWFTKNEQYHHSLIK